MEDGQLATRFCARRMQADESVDPTQTLAELLHSNFVDNGQMSWLLEAMAQDALAPLFSFQISPLLGREINSQSKVIEDLLEEYERLEKQRTEVEDLHYWNPSDETRNELEDVENRLAEAKAYVEYQTSKGVSELTTSLEYLALAVSSTSKEKKARSTSNEETQKRSYWARYNTIKGSIAENAIAQLLCCFQIPTTFQHVHGTGRGDLVAHSLHSSFDRVWHEVKCIECISTREELQLQATIARGERIIVYHFLRLLQHQAAGFEAWMHSIMGKLSRLLANNQRLHAGQVSVYVFFYRKPLLSPRASPDLCTGSLSASLMFHGCTATELLQSARCFSFHRAQTVDYTLPQTRPPRLDEDDILLRTIQQSSLLLALSFAVPLSFSDLRKLLQRIGQDGINILWPSHLSIQEACAAAQYITKYLDRPIALQYKQNAGYLLWHEIDLCVEEEGAYWTHTPGRFFDGLAVQLYVGQPPPTFFYAANATSWREIMVLPNIILLRYDSATSRILPSHS